MTVSETIKVALPLLLAYLVGWVFGSPLNFVFFIIGIVIASLITEWKS